MPFSLSRPNVARISSPKLLPTAGSHSSAWSSVACWKSCSRSNGQIGNGHTNGRLATASQVRAICGIAKRQKIDLSAALQERFGVGRPDDLTIGQASEFIDAIKPQPSGAGGRQ